MWLRGLPEEEKDGLVATAVEEPGERWRNELLRRFRRQNEPRNSHAYHHVERRTAAEILAAAQARAEERIRLLNTTQAAEAKRQKAKDEADRARYLDQLEKREEAAWNQISAHIQKRQPNEYDKAVSLLVDLHGLAVRKQQVPKFQAALEKLREAHAAKESFLRRLSKAKL